VHIAPEEKSPQAAEVLEVTLESSAATCRLILRGSLCVTTIAALQSQIDQLGCAPCHEVVVDMHGLTEMDTVGAKVVLGLYHYVVGRGGQLRVRGPLSHIAATLDSVAESVIPVDDPPLSSALSN
jgi:anti-anti-sigma factor